MKIYPNDVSYTVRKAKKKKEKTSAQISDDKIKALQEKLKNQEKK